MQSEEKSRKVQARQTGGGNGTGKVLLTGRDGQQTLRFDYALKNAKLGPLAEAIEEFRRRDRRFGRVGQAAV